MIAFFVYTGHYDTNKSVIIRVLASLLNDKELVAREHSVLIVVQSVVRISQLIHSLAIDYRLVDICVRGASLRPFDTL